jgi:hypothetical protein
LQYCFEELFSFPREDIEETIEATHISKAEIEVLAHGTTYLLLRLVYRGKLSRKKAREAVDKMISIGWRLTAEYGNS